MPSNDSSCNVLFTLPQLLHCSVPLAKRLTSRSALQLGTTPIFNDEIGERRCGRSAFRRKVLGSSCFRVSCSTQSTCSSFSIADTVPCKLFTSCLYRVFSFCMSTRLCTTWSSRFRFSRIRHRIVDFNVSMKVFESANFSVAAHSFCWNCAFSVFVLSNSHASPSSLASLTCRSRAPLTSSATFWVHIASCSTFVDAD